VLERSDDSGVAEPEPPEDALSEQWDRLSPAERIEAATTGFREAVDAISAQHEVGRNLTKAETALSTLRAELYATERGRRQHQALERELDRVTSDNGM
jgi:hypothetical protein